MYQSRVSRVLSHTRSTNTSEVDEAMWKLFLAVGDFWKLQDNPGAYRLRLRSFMTNRIKLNPLYLEIYPVAREVIDGLLAEHGSPKGYEVLFTQKSRTSPTAPPETLLEFTQQYVANEFIGLRLALGSFRVFGAENYRGYFGGANIDGVPSPYRTMPSQP